MLKSDKIQHAYVMANMLWLSVSGYELFECPSYIVIICYSKATYSMMAHSVSIICRWPGKFVPDEVMEILIKGGDVAKAVPRAHGLTSCMEGQQQHTS